METSFTEATRTCWKLPQPYQILHISTPMIVRCCESVPRFFFSTTLNHFKALRWLFREEGAACTISLHWTRCIVIGINCAWSCLMNNYHILSSLVQLSVFFQLYFNCLICPGLVMSSPSFVRRWRKAQIRQRFSRRFTTWWRHLTAALIRMGVQCFTSRRQQPGFPSIA